MKTSRFLVIAMVLALAACGSREPAGGGSSVQVGLGSLPATVEGVLVVDVAEGDVDTNGNSEIYFGTLTVGQEELLVEVGGEILVSAGIPEEGARVRATLGSKSDENGATLYKVDSLSLL